MHGSLEINYARGVGLSIIHVYHLPAQISICNQYIVYYLQDCLGHGTACASAAAGLVFGVAPGATIHSVKVLDCFTDDEGIWTSAGSISIILSGGYIVRVLIIASRDLSSKFI